MAQTAQQALDTLEALASPEQMRRLAEGGVSPKRRPRLNLHVHLPPNFSAFESVEQVIDLADQQGIGVLGAGNYYDYRVYGEFADHARRRGIFPVFGTELICMIDELREAGEKINDPGNPGKMYLCGKGIVKFADPGNRADELMAKVRRNDAERMSAMSRKLEAIFADHGLATGLDDRGVIARVVERHECPAESVVLQERHLAQAFQERLFELLPQAQPRREKLARLLGGFDGDVEDPVKVQGEIRSKLMKAGKPAFVPETFVNFSEAYELVCELGGIPCYPTLADGTEPICPFETPVEELIDNIRSRGLYAAEFIPVRNEPDVLSEYVTAMHEAGLVIASGTEHNTLDLIGLEPTCRGGAPVPEEVREIFWRGACVIAAHQFLVLNGECGFVDGRGRLNPNFASDAARIESLARLGAAVIETYFQTHPEA
jgi:hypothetical protein